MFPAVPRGMRSIVLALLVIGCAAEDASPGSATSASACEGLAACEPATLGAPPIGCGPKDVCAPVCSKPPACPRDPCMSATRADDPDVIALRIGRSKIWAPEALRALAGIAVDANVTAKCAGGSESFNWLIKIDRKKGTITTGGARPSSDGVTYRFAREQLDSAKIASVCPGFTAGAEPIAIAPVTSALTLEGTKFTSPTAKRVNVAIFADEVPLVLPLSESTLVDVQLSENGSCVGAFDANYACDGDTRGWTTGGAIVSKITLEDADRVPIKAAGCLSLCALLANDASKIGPDNHCKRGSDGKIPELGDTCVGGEGCKNAFRLVTTFGAYRVKIED